VLDDVPDGLVKVVVAHELTHALEDQHHDLDARIEAELDDDDRLAALTAVHEGSATLLMNAYMVQALAAGDIDATELAESQAGLVGVGGFAELPDVLRRQMVAPYLLGAAFLARGQASHAVLAAYPAADVDRAYSDPPRSSEQILHPERYWDPERRDEPIAVEPGQAGRELGSGFTRAATGTLGELTLGTLVGAPTPAVDGSDPNVVFAAAWTNAAATGWGGDRWELWTRGDRAAVLLATVWDTERDAEEFAAALPERERGEPARRDFPNRHCNQCTGDSI